MQLLRMANAIADLKGCAALQALGPQAVRCRARGYDVVPIAPRTGFRAISQLRSNRQKI